MAKAVYLGVGGQSRKVPKMYIGVGGQAKRIFKAYIGVGGQAKAFFFDLDASYERVEYIDAATEGPYIVLPITTQEGLKLYFKAAWTWNNNPTTYIGGGTGASKAMRFRFHDGDGATVQGEGEVDVPHSNANQIAAGNVVQDTLADVEIDFGDYNGTRAGHLTVAGDTYNFTRIALENPGSQMGLFAWMGSSGATVKRGRFGEVKAYDKNNDLIMDFIPVVKRTGRVPGFFDLVSMKFYGNVGTGSFTAGPNI